MQMNWSETASGELLLAAGDSPGLSFLGVNSLQNALIRFSGVSEEQKRKSGGVFSDEIREFLMVQSDQSSTFPR